MVIVSENGAPPRPGIKEQRQYFFFLKDEEVSKSIIKIYLCV